jgi:hypothetical protein
MFITDDPASDYDRYCQEQERYQQRLPVCVDCGEAVQDDHYYLICDEVICPDCLESGYRKYVDEFIE